MTEPKKPLTGLTRTQFAKELGVGKSYITALGHQGRLVLHPDGSVDATATRAVIESTVSAPGRGVATTKVFMDNNEIKAYYQAQTARLDYEERCGLLLKADEVRLIVAAAATSLRSRLEPLPENLSPTLAAMSEESQIKATLANEIEAALSEMSHHFAKLASRAVASANANQPAGGAA